MSKSPLYYWEEELDKNKSKKIERVTSKESQSDMEKGWGACKNKVLEILDKYNHTAVYPYIKEEINKL